MSNSKKNFISEKIIATISRKNEEKVKKQFEKFNLKVKRLDTKGNKNNKRPDFLIFDRTHKIICEVKTVLSLDYNNEIGHVSIYKSEIQSGTASSYDDSSKFKSILEGSVAQYHGLIKDEPKYQNTPFCIALFVDYYPTNSLVSRHLEKFNEISALLKILENHELLNEFKKYPVKELVEIYERKKKVKLPPPTKKWEVLRNKNALHKVPLFFFGDPIIISN